MTHHPQHTTSTERKCDKGRGVLTDKLFYIIFQFLSTVKAAKLVNVKVYIPKY